MFALLKEEFGRGEEMQAKELEGAMTRRRQLEVEVKKLQCELARNGEEINRIKEEQQR